MEEKKVEILSYNRPNEVSEGLFELTENWLKDGRRYFGIAGAGLRNQIDDPKYKEFNIKTKLVEAGITGEKKTSKILRDWIKDKPECVLIDSISLPLEKMDPEVDGEDGQLDLGDTDHLLIVGDYLVIIDSKNWKEKASYTVQEDGSILRAKKTFPGNKPRINQAKYLWQNYMNELGIPQPKAFVCLSNEKSIIVRDANWWRVGYQLVNQSEESLIKFLNKLYKEDLELEDPFIRIELVAMALKGVIKPYNKMKERFGNIYKRAYGQNK